jgi:hypothetical protein
MAKKSGMTRQDLKVMEFLRLGGTKIPAGFASKAAAATNSVLQEKLGAGNAFRKQGAKLYSELKGASTVAVNDPANKKALDGLLSWHKKIAGKKLAFPKVPAGVSVFLPGSFSGTIAPPFEFADTIPALLANVSNPPLSLSASVNGQISASAASRKGPDGASAQSSRYEGGNLLLPSMTQGTSRRFRPVPRIPLHGQQIP